MGVTEASFSEDLVGADKSYTNVTIDFYQLGISLEATRDTYIGR